MDRFHSLEAQQLKRLRIAHPIENLGWFPAYVGIKKGIFAKYGLELLMIRIRSALAITAMSTKEIQYISTLGTPMSAISRGLSGKVVMILCHKPFFVLVASDDIKSPKDLRGRTIAINRFGGSLDLSLVWILESFGMKRSDVKMLPVGHSRNAYLALQAKKVDAAILSSPLDFLL